MSKFMNLKARAKKHTPISVQTDVVTPEYLEQVLQGPLWDNLLLSSKHTDCLKFTGNLAKSSVNNVCARYRGNLNDIFKRCESKFA